MFLYHRYSESLSKGANNDYYLFIYLFRLFIQRLFKSTTTQKRSRHSTNTPVSEFHAEAPQATVSEGLAQGPYVAARAGFDPMTLRTKGVDTTNGPPRFTLCHME